MVRAVVWGISRNSRIEDLISRAHGTGTNSRNGGGVGRVRQQELGNSGNSGIEVLLGPRATSANSTNGGPLWR